MFKEFFIDGKKVKDLYINGKKVKIKPSEFLGLTFTAEEANSTVAMSSKSSAPTLNLEYSIDGSTWNTFTVGSTTITLSNIGDKVYFRGNNTSTATTNQDKSNYFTGTGKVSISGNLQSLLNSENFENIVDLPDGAFAGLFQNMTSLVDAGDAKITANGNIGKEAFSYMFQNCNITRQIQIPELFASAKAATFNSMFTDCPKLTTIMLPDVTNVSSSDCAYMFNSYCGGNSDIQSSLLSADVKYSGPLYDKMFQYTFYYKRTLNDITVNFPAWGSSDGFTQYWVVGVPSTGKFKCPISLGSDETIKRGSHNCPNNWVVYHGTDQLSNCAIRYTKDYIETGSEIRPDVQVYSDIDGELMTEGTGYTVSYSDNILPGTGHITITGLGDFAGQTVIKDFTIAPSTLESCTFEYSKVYKYTGSPIEPNLTVKNAIGNTLTINTDYTVSYQDNTNIGTGKIIITGAGVYTGSKTFDFLIVSADDFKTTLWRNNTEPEATDYDVSGQMTTSNTGRSGWYNADNAITKIQIGLGVSDVEQNYFYKTNALTEIDLTKFTNPNIICKSQATSSFDFTSNIQNIYVANSEMETAFKAA